MVVLADDSTETVWVRLAAVDLRQAQLFCYLPR